jgi:hypothetical protein
MEESARSEKILTLGRKLVEELGLEPSVDTLGRWMAHYIAELIDAAESTSGEQRFAAQKKCFEAILALWKHRAELPSGKRPFEDLGLVTRAIESLDPEDDTPRYYRSARPQKSEEEETEAQSWLDTVSGLDHSAKVLIGYCLGEAARAAVDKSKDWVALAEAAGAEPGVPEIVIRFVSNAADLGKTADINDDVRKKLEDRINRLKGFAQMAAAMVSDLTARLNALPPPKKTDGDSEPDHIVLRNTEH